MTSIERRIERANRAAAQARAAHRPEVVVPARILEFAFDFLGMPYLYPAQALLLKLMFLELESLTDDDHQLLAEWQAGFSLPTSHDTTLRYEGACGVAPDVLDRVAQCQSMGREYFAEVVAVIGRRGSKGLLGAIAGARIIWGLLAGGVHESLSITPDKRLTVFVFAGEKSQARGNQFRELADRITYAPCFEPFIAGRTSDSLMLYTADQLANDRRPSVDEATIHIVARAATPLAGRGPAAIMAYFDEMAHMVAAGANRSAQEVFDAAIPALAQFEAESFIYEASSPWTRTGRFYENYEQGLVVDPETHSALSPTTLVVQLPSVEMYRDWERTTDGELLQWPGGPPLPPTRPAVLTEFSPILVEERKRNPENYRTEYGAEWASTRDAYLRQAEVDALFAPWRGETLTMHSYGTLGVRYVAHADPSSVNANFAIAVGHLEVDDVTNPHVVFDFLHVWKPGDFPDHTINYDTVEDDICGLLQRFRLAMLTSDQFNVTPTLQRLRRRATEMGLYPQPVIEERTATAEQNWKIAEVFHAAAVMRRVHLPQHDLARLELEFLERRDRRIGHPTTGPVQTDDLADAIMHVTYTLLEDDPNVFEQLGGLPPGGALPGGVPNAHDQAIFDQFSNARLPRGYGHGEQRQRPGRR